MTAKRVEIDIRLDLMPAECLLEVSKVFAVGAKNHGEHNWKESRMSGANGPINHSLKHLLSYQAGIPDDEGDDPKIHLTHAITNLLIELYYEIHEGNYPKEK